MMSKRYSYRYTLNENLNGLPLKDLELLAKRNQLSNLNVLSDQEIKKELETYFKSEYILREKLVVLSMNEINLLKSILNNNCRENINDHLALFRLGFIYVSLNNDSDYEIAYDLIEPIDKILNDESFIIENQQFHKINNTLKAYVNLKGYLELSFLVLNVFK